MTAGAKGEEELLSFLASHAVPDSRERAAQCLQAVDGIRQNLLKSERTISLLPLLSAPSYPSGIIPDKHAIMKHILSPEVMQTKDVTPAFAQHSSLFVNFIHGRPELFAKVVYKRYGQQDFHFMVYSVVPSIFGFFSSDEHISSAAVFYQHIIKLAPPQVAASILQPFFCSLCSFRFLEGVMDQFCPQFGGEIRLDDPKRKKELLPSFASSLMSLIKENINLMPSVILVLFNTMVHMNWNLKSLIDIFFNRFFNHQSIAWIASSPFAHRVSVFQEILQIAIDNVKLVREVLRSFVEARTEFEVPSAYTSFGEDFIQVFISISDIMCAARCFSTEDELPYSLRDVNYEVFPVDKRFSPFLIRIYTKNLVYYSAQQTHLFFESYQPKPIEHNPIFDRIFRQLANNGLPSEQVYEYLLNNPKNMPKLLQEDIINSKKFLDYARTSSLNTLIASSKAFENLLVYRVSLGQMKEWNNLATKRQLALMTPMALKAARTAMKYYPGNIGHAFSHASRCFLSSALKRLQFYTIVIPSFGPLLEIKKSFFTDLEDKWQLLLKEAFNSFDGQSVNNLSKHSQFIFWSCVEEIRSLTNIPSTRQFDLLTRTIWKLYLIGSKDESIIRASVLFASNPKLPAIFLLSNHFIVASPFFQTLLDDETLKNWGKFNTFLHHFMRDSSAFKAYEALFSELGGTTTIMDISDSDSTSFSTWLYGAPSSDLYKLSSSE